MKIHVLLTGRLGNQLFQYAFAKRIQQLYGGQIYLNIYDLEHRSGKRKKVSDHKFEYDMKDFKLNKDVILEDVKLPWYADLGNLIIKVIKKTVPKLYFNTMASHGYLLWQRPDYIDIPKLTSDSVFIHGYWQDIRYLSGVENELREWIKPEIEGFDNEICRISRKKDSVCISIRGGNYLNPKIKKDLFVCNREYFINAIKKMDGFIKNPTYIIFSDDLKWVKEYIQLEKEFPDKEFIYEGGNNNVAEKIYMMSLCSNFIISNSSFSWWAQFLSANDNKIVIAPDAWFTNGSRNGLYMKDWITIGCGQDE